MSTLLKAIIAVILGLIVAGVLDYLGILNHGLNVLIGIAAGLLFFFGYNGTQLH